MATEIVDYNSPTANMYGCQPCPQCGGTKRAAFEKSGFIECDDCGYNAMFILAEAAP